MILRRKLVTEPFAMAGGQVHAAVDDQEFLPATSGRGPRFVRHSPTPALSHSPHSQRA